MERAGALALKLKISRGKKGISTSQPFRLSLGSLLHLPSFAGPLQPVSRDRLDMELLLL
jgi:hypothetical protein